jgi:hypothetical protein
MAPEAGSSDAKHLRCFDSKSGKNRRHPYPALDLVDSRMEGKCFWQKHFRRDRARLSADAKRLGQPLTQPKNKKAALVGGLLLSCQSERDIGRGPLNEPDYFFRR